MTAKLQNNCYIGLTQWQHAAWQDGPLNRSSGNHVLAAYARHFSSVEGNTTFYGLPKPNTVTQWLQETPAAFRFCFKFPQQISHQNQLRLCDSETTAFLNCLSPLRHKLGLLCLQLPASFGPDQLGLLNDFLSGLPKDFCYGVEVRHPDFFDKGEGELDLNRLLADLACNRISFDTRALFALPEKDPASIRAREHKPQLPVHALSTAQQPMVRFITPMDWRWGREYLTPWIAKTIAWLDAGKSPFFFFHTPDNAEAPALAAWFVNAIEAQRPDSCLFQGWEDYVSQQPTLF